MVVRTLPWAVGLPLGAAGAGVLAQYPHGLVVGVVLGLAVAATAPSLAGAAWRRSGAATIAVIAALALPFFAGPAVYEVYIKNAGDQVDARVTHADEVPNGQGTELSVCHVTDGAGKEWRLSQRQNCFGQLEPGQRVVLYTDPVGGLAPWVETGRDAATEPTAPAITVGLFLVLGGSLLYAGARRRTDAEVAAAKGHRHGAPRAAESVD